jgi:uncharacterized cupin superfamily protein
MPKIEISAAPVRTGTSYPSPHDVPCRDRHRARLGDAGGLTDFGVNLLTLKPGVWSSQCHWHRLEDEFVYIVSGEVVLVTDKGETVMRAGDCAAFPKNDGDGHHQVNRSDRDAVLLEVGARSGGDTVFYSDIDLISDPARGYTRKDGTIYPAR